MGSCFKFPLGAAPPGCPARSAPGANPARGKSSHRPLGPLGPLGFLHTRNRVPEVGSKLVTPKTLNILQPERKDLEFRVRT